MKVNKNIIYGVIGGLVIGLGLIYLSRRKKSDKVTSILFIGDSNTAANYSYADKLKKQFPNIDVKKIAKVGEKTDWMKNQLQNELNKKDYDIIIILGGSNDVYALGKTDSAKQNLNAMYDLIHSKGAKVIAVTPPNKDFYVNKTEAKQKLLFDLIDWMKSNKKIDYLIDFHKITSDKKYFSPSDGYLHANSLAHEILANSVKNELNLKA